MRSIEWDFRLAPSSSMGLVFMSGGHPDLIIVLSTSWMGFLILFTKMVIS